MGYLLVAYMAFSHIGPIPIMKWTPVEEFYATTLANIDEAEKKCLAAGAELKVKKFKCVKFFEKQSK